MSVKILGISAFYHDAAAALIEDGAIVAAAQEERFTRWKHDPGFPLHSIRFCLNDANIQLEDLDAIVFYDKPFLKLERLLETYYAFAPRGLASFVNAIPVWLKEKMFLKDLIKKELKKLGNWHPDKTKLLFPEHHLSHAASAFFASPFSKAVIVTIDGVGEWATASICYGDGNSITVLRELRFPHSMGLFYSAFTYFLGFKVNSGEYKVMGLAPYGNKNSPATHKFTDLILSHLVRLHDDGSMWLNQKYFSYATGLRMVPDRKWEKLFGFPPRRPEDTIEQHHCDLALAMQQVTEEAMLRITRYARSIISDTDAQKNLCLAGGVALNCVANGKIWKERLFDNIFIQPAAGDAGGAIGAALAASFIYYQQPRVNINASDLMKGAFLGPEPDEKEILAIQKKYKAKFQFFTNTDDLLDMVALLLAQGKVVGWVQGRMEFGPRALGNRSILADPRIPDMQKTLNMKIKFREGFRPFAPAVCSEDARSIFDLETDSPYMLLVGKVREQFRNPLPPASENLSMLERLYLPRSPWPAITHIDYSARVQTVHKETNPFFHALIQKFKKQTGCPILVNTSFNIRGQPIVCSPEDAYICFMATDMDVLVVNHHLFLKDDQPVHDKKKFTILTQPD